MLLNVIKKMIHFDETGRLIEQSNNEHNSVVNNFSGQIQAILRFNFRSEFNNSSNTMKKIYEISYLFYKICYKNDKDLFLSQFWLLYDPIFTLTKQKSREDSIYRLRFLSQTLVRLVQDEESSEETLKLLTRKESGPGELLILLEDFLEDTLGVLMSINTQKSQIENLKIRLLNDKMDVGVYIETIPVAISAYVALKSLARTKISEKNERKIKFILSYILVSDSLLRKIVSSLEKMESKAETYDIEKYFEDRKSILSAFNLLVKNNFAFESSELELVYQVMINLIKVGMPEHLKLIKDFCFLALKSSNFPKDRPLLELINQFPKGQVRMAAIMAGLYKAISSQKVEQTEDGSMFDLNLMGETVVYRFVHESTQEEVLSEEMKATLVAILSLDFEVAYKSVVMDWLAKYRSDNRMSSCIYFGLLAKLHTEIASELLVQHLKTDFEMVFSGLVSFSEIVKINKEALLNREQSVVSVFEVCISGILDSLQSKKTEEAQKKLNLVLLCIQTLCDFLAKSSNEQTKKSLIMLTFSANDFLLQKIPAKFFEDKVLCLIGSLLLNPRIAETRYSFANSIGFS